MGYVVTLIVGILIGIVISVISTKEEKIYGVIEIDHHSQQCRSRITSDELLDRKTTKAVFEVTHDAIISQEEQGL